MQAAPIGLAVAISAAALAGTAVSTSTVIAATKTIAMTTLQKAIVATTVAVLAGSGIYEAHQATQLRAQNQALQEQQEQTHRQQEQMTAQNRRLQQASDQLSAGAARLRADSQALQQVKAEDEAAANDPSQKAMLSWLDRVERLKQLLEQTPGAKIPEMQWLTEQDWLSAAHGKLETDDDYHRAFSNLRGIAANKFSFKAFPALQKYQKANNGKFPTDLSQLQPYFDSPIDPSILQGWQIVPAVDVPSLKFGGDWIITQKTAVDEELDTRVGIGANGYGSAGSGFDPAINTLEQVVKAFAVANPGRSPADISEMLPYATTPEQQAALRKQIDLQQSIPPRRRMPPCSKRLLPRILDGHPGAIPNCCLTPPRLNSRPPCGRRIWQLPPENSSQRLRRRDHGGEEAHGAARFQPPTKPTAKRTLLPHRARDKMALRGTVGTDL